MITFVRTLKLLLGTAITVLLLSLPIPVDAAEMLLEWSNDAMFEASGFTGEFDHVAAYSAGRRAVVMADGSVKVWEMPEAVTSALSTITNAQKTAATAEQLAVLLKDGTVRRFSLFPHLPSRPDLLDVVDIAYSAPDKLVAVLRDGTVVREERGVLRPLTEFSNVTSIATSPGDAVFGVTTAGEVMMGGSRAPLAPQPGLTNVIQVSAGLDYALALRADGTLAAWGSGNYIPIPPAGLAGVAKIATRSGVAWALLHDGTLLSWSASAPNPVIWPFKAKDIAVSGLTLAVVDESVEFAPLVLSPVQQNERVALPGDPLTFQAGGIGWPKPTFQWFKNGLEIPNATNVLLTIESADYGDSGTYHFEARNSKGAAGGLTTLRVADSHFPSLTPQNKDFIAQQGFRAALRVRPNIAFRVQGSYDLRTWIDLTNAVSLTKDFPFIDYTSGESAQRFYRVVLP